jgi:hypothetical protein
MSDVPNKFPSLLANVPEGGSSPECNLRQPAGNPQKGTKCIAQ